MRDDLVRYLAVAKDAVAIGHDLLATNRPTAVREKGDRDLVTDLDERIQAEIATLLAKATPEVQFLGEEQRAGALDQDAEYVWALDPIDGTSNFAHSLPLCGTSLALLRRGEPVIGAVAAPFLALLYTAVEGQGAQCNGELLRVRQTRNLARAIVSIGDYATGDRAATRNVRRFGATKALAENVERVRMFGSAALDLAWVAEGRTDACVIFSNKPWDTAAGVLIAREAGARVVDADGAEHNTGSRETIAVTPGISDQLLHLLPES